MRGLRRCQSSIARGRILKARNFDGVTASGRSTTSFISICLSSILRLAGSMSGMRIRCLRRVCRTLRQNDGALPYRFKKDAASVTLCS